MIRNGKALSKQGLLETFRSQVRGLQHFSVHLPWANYRLEHENQTSSLPLWRLNKEMRLVVQGCSDCGTGKHEG